MRNANAGCSSNNVYQVDYEPENFEYTLSGLFKRE